MKLAFFWFHHLSAAPPAMDQASNTWNLFLRWGGLHILTITIMLMKS
jgi:hypothetical protein